MAGSDSTLPLFAGLVTRLKAWSALTAIVSTKIYSRVPQQTDLPYVVISISSGDWSAKDFMGMVHKVRVQGFSSAGTPVEALQIRAAVIEALERQESNITVSGYNLVSFEKGSLSDIILENDGITQQSIVEFDAIIT